MHSSKNKKLQKYSAKNISKNPENSWCEESTDITSTQKTVDVKKALISPAHRKQLMWRKHWYHQHTENSWCEESTDITSTQKTVDAKKALISPAQSELVLLQVWI